MIRWQPHRLRIPYPWGMLIRTAFLAGAFGGRFAHYVFGDVKMVQTAPNPNHAGTPAPLTTAAEPSAPVRLTDAQRELLEDKYVLWERQGREGSVDYRDYHRRAAEALKAALAICSEAW